MARRLSLIKSLRKLRLKILLKAVKRRTEVIKCWECKKIIPTHFWSLRHSRNFILFLLSGTHRYFECRIILDIIVITWADNGSVRGWKEFYWAENESTRVQHKRSFLNVFPIPHGALELLNNLQIITILPALNENANDSERKKIRNKPKERKNEQNCKIICIWNWIFFCNSQRILMFACWLEFISLHEIHKILIYICWTTLSSWNVVSSSHVRHLAKRHDGEQLPRHNPSCQEIFHNIRIKSCYVHTINQQQSTILWFLQLFRTIVLRRVSEITSSIIQGRTTS